MSLLAHDGRAGERSRQRNVVIRSESPGPTQTQSRRSGDDSPDPAAYDGDLEVRSQPLKKESRSEKKHAGHPGRRIPVLRLRHDPTPRPTARRMQRIDLSGGSVAVGVGVDWAKGTLHFKGQDVPVKVKGVSLVRVGASKVSATGEVYNLKELSEFAGNYSAVAAGAALAGGGSVSAMQNEHGVVMHLRSTTVGADLDLGVKGLEVSLDK